ncbi:hypothetical protein DXN05_07570 [Deminuibacter soli]|uniref:Uncharacterized protein n=1 Tax=Deminuibacter soli TaxID=2291815 RepID=A0A3E1NLC3_9BACT|nr:hypothetical protein DXN05_07570 [Deminuibacter soli]
MPGCFILVLKELFANIVDCMQKILAIFPALNRFFGIILLKFDGKKDFKKKSLIFSFFKY